MCVPVGLQTWRTRRQYLSARRCESSHTAPGTRRGGGLATLKPGLLLLLWVQKGVLPQHWPHVELALGQVFNLTAFALSLLLVFRTNSRWGLR